MEIKTMSLDNCALKSELLSIWEASTRATHDFLSSEDIVEIRLEVQQAFDALKDITCVVSGAGCVCGFMGVSGHKIEMLFIHPSHRGLGLGKKLVAYALENFQISLVDVNEQNSQALEFYKHLGFKVIGRSNLDSSGRPFPILHMEK